MNKEDKNHIIQITGSLLAKNTVLNFIGQVIPLFVAVITIPYIIHGLGTERFGILSIAWTVLGYFSFFDLGLGRATTKFVAEALGKGETEKIPAIVWTSLLFIIVLSITGAGILIALTPLLVERILNIPDYLIEETKIVFYITSASVLITLLTATLSAVLESYQRFDLVNMLRAPSNILTYFIPLIALYAGAGLPAIVLLILIKNLVILIFYLSHVLKTMPDNKIFLINLKIAPSLFTYGWWIALHNIAVAILLYLDRFLIGVFLTMSAVSFYTVPYELVSKAAIVPSSIILVLFPAFSSIGAISRQKLQEIFNKAFRYMFSIMGLITSVLVVFSKEILLLWLGNEFAEESTLVFQIFAVGVFFSSLAWLSGTLLQGIGNPRDVAVIHMLQVPIYILSTWLLIRLMGTKGAALSWSIRIFLSLCLLLFLCHKAKLFRFTFLLQNEILRSITVFCTTSGVAIVAKSFISFSLMNLSIVFLVFIVLLSVIVWKLILDQSDRRFIICTLRNPNSVTKGGELNV